MINSSKQYLVLGTPKQRAKISVPSISVNGEIVKILNIPIGNLGSVFDSKAVKSANYHLTLEGSENTWLSTKGAVISLVTRFDYCNGLLCGIPEELICKLQRVQNNAARVILTKKYDHITPVLKELHCYQSGRELNSRTSVCMELHPLTWGKCSMSHHGHWDQHPRTYSWKTVTDHLVPGPKTMESAPK